MIGGGSSVTSSKSACALTYESLSTICVLRRANLAALSPNSHLPYRCLSSSQKIPTVRCAQDPVLTTGGPFDGSGARVTRSNVGHSRKSSGNGRE